jgi:pre-mRNA 3'-end-processing factor FIP1
LIRSNDDDEQYSNELRNGDNDQFAYEDDQANQKSIQLEEHVDNTIEATETTVNLNQNEIANEEGAQIMDSDSNKKADDEEFEEDDEDDDDDDLNVVIDIKPYGAQSSSLVANANLNNTLNRQKSKTQLTGVSTAATVSATNIVVSGQTAAQPNAQAGLKTTLAKGVDLDAPGTINGVPTYEYDIQEIKDEDKPWKKPGADITDYFNYGFTEETWIAYCMKQKRLRAENSVLKVNKFILIN